MTQKVIFKDRNKKSDLLLERLKVDHSDDSLLCLLISQ